FDGLPVFSPDGTKLCWTSGRAPDGQSQLFLADWNHEAALIALDQSGLRTSTSNTVRSQITDHASRFTSPQITVQDLRSDVTYLASNALEGRATGSPGARLAADFIADQFRQIGLKPFGTNTSYFQDYEFNSGVRVLTNANQLILTRSEGAPAA